MAIACHVHISEIIVLWSVIQNIFTANEIIKMNLVHNQVFSRTQQMIVSTFTESEDCD